ncbi:MAG: hypothetical protein IT290_12255, partial [Deltaproteobacteria bacterium]|nr:hypothetical protein [Deltaproteobacteria bacterium]
MKFRSALLTAIFTLLGVGAAHADTSTEIAGYSVDSVIWRLSNSDHSIIPSSSWGLPVTGRDYLYADMIVTAEEPG